MSALIIILPRKLTSRAVARHLVPGSEGSQDIVLNASETTRIAPAAADSLVQSLLRAAPQRVIVVNATDTAQRALQVVHRARATPERSFLLTFRTLPAEALLRAV
ncbi:MAG: hypothetical protein AAGC63_11035 [Propionicimonas sp.]